ncbi:type VI secretion system baseplate subunit TssF [Pseudoduganella lutea]|uniref:Type VI secretion system baseplate subunit TssF n=1 Tax=Pseudoduganella lutea TaxID=321985 RepID=A0A4P6L523_9BURK|nr:type VI secretion system baseplate subunit TssF [Pseudoduganella lutea]QBE66709.1 type VI secretion system baseplate subunit TssF [Pseudoduganella lutea]
MTSPRFLHYYSQELQHLREMGGEFAARYPKIAGRLGLEGFDCADPYVERLLEGFSFLTARVQMKIDAEFPRFTQHLSELVYPDFLAPTPSMAVVQCQPDLASPALAPGFRIPAGTTMRSLLGKDDLTACEYRTAHALTLWPMELVEAKFFTHGGSIGGIANVEHALPPGIKAGLRLRLRTTHDAPFDTLALDRLALHLRGGDALPAQIYERLLASAAGVLVMPARRPATWYRLLPRKALQPAGFTAAEALLPGAQRSFEGYRLLQEYFAFASRFLFLDITGLRDAVSCCADSELDIVILLDQGDARLEQMLDTAHFALNCTPVVNLFPRRADRIDLSGDLFEHHVLVDRTRPMDFEVHSIAGVTGYGSGADGEQRFEPLYGAADLGGPRRAYYHVRREPRLLSQRQRERGPRSSYVGSETFISLVDAGEAPYRHDLRQLGVSVWCTNRDLPLSMPLGVGSTDFMLEGGAPVQAVRVVAGPSRPLPSFADGAMAWRLINQLSLNYLSLVDAEDDPREGDARITGARAGEAGNGREGGRAEGAVALRELLALYCHKDDPIAQRQVEGVRSVHARPVTRRMPTPGPITFGRGLEITVTLDDAAFEGAGAFLLGGVLNHFFAQYASINTFTETVVRTVGRGTIMRWAAREGACAIL